MPKRRVEQKQGQNGDENEIQLVEEEEVSAWSSQTDLQIVGQSHPRLEGREKVTGRARYASDVRLPGQLYARVLRSPYPHAHVRRIDVSKAEQAPGVHAVVSAANVPDIPWYEEGVLFESTVRFVGDEVAAVAAESEELARDALRLIEVDYEPLSFVSSIEEALRPGAPTVHEGGNIAGEPKTYQRGDPDAGLRQADVVIEAAFETASALHNALESHGCTASWEGDSLTLWDSTQSVFTVRQQVAEKLGLPEHRVRVIKHHMGGGFGAKQIAWKHDVIASILSRQAGRPVQLMLDREAENLAAGNRNPTHQRVRLGARRDGTLTAIVTEIEQSSGAYRTGGEASNVSGMYQTLYRCPNVRTEQVAVYTNTGPAVAFRAPG
ncbi:MAG: xanthine dehydrogenase family protein molybdopterin-binding subunit, partial [Chloroflexi bacterium]|nr:xanthine dehydrogenase family protein molybdopterin-binding subunit [Chloroflexota bacterium]